MDPARAETSEFPEPGECRAVIDVGTNSVKLLVGRVQASNVIPLTERSRQTRLGADFFATRRLQPAAIERTAAAVLDFRREAEDFRPRRLRVVATAAAREAVNREDLLRALRRVADLELDVLDGNAEADLAFRGVCSDPRLASLPLLVSDLGGGSTEFIVGSQGHRHYQASFPLGTVRLFESLPPTDPPQPGELAKCRKAIDSFLTEHIAGPVQSAWSREPDPPPTYVAVGGTASILASLHLALPAFDRARIEDTVLSAADLRALTERLWTMSLADRRRLPGLPPDRADIVLTGAAIHEGIVRCLHLPGLRPSTRGLRYAALLDPA